VVESRVPPVNRARFSHRPYPFVPVPIHIPLSAPVCVRERTLTEGSLERKNSSLIPERFRTRMAVRNRSDGLRDGGRRDDRLCTLGTIASNRAW
jgi:hypothetical protein